jgi:hypothetical protein
LWLTAASRGKRRVGIQKEMSSRYGRAASFGDVIDLVSLHGPVSADSVQIGS